MSEPNELLISVPKVAKRLGVSPRTVWKLIHDGLLPSKRIYRRTLVSVKALETWANDRNSTALDDGV